MAVTIEKSDHTKLATVRLDGDGTWAVRVAGVVGGRPDPAAIAIAVSEAISLILLDPEAMQTHDSLEKSRDRAAGTFARYRDAAGDINFKETAARLARLRDESPGGEELPTAPPPQPTYMAGPVTVVARDGVVSGIRIDEAAAEDSIAHIEQAIGLALTRASQESLSASEQAQDDRLHARLRDTIVYESSGGSA